MKPRSHRFFPLTLVVCVAPLLACSAASASVATFNENSTGLTWPLPAVTNLLADPGVTGTPATANVNNAPSTSNSWATLTDGLLPTVDPNPAEIHTTGTGPTANISLGSIGLPGTCVQQESATMIENPWPTSALIPAAATDQRGKFSADYVRMEVTVPINSARKFVRVEATE